MPNTAIQLRIEGKSYTDFKSATISWSIETFARTFTITLADHWLHNEVFGLPFVEGDAVEVWAHGTKVIDGFIDDIPISYDANRHEVQIVGRSWTGHMVDSSAVAKPGSWRNTTLLAVAQELLAPYGQIAMVDPAVAGLAAKPFKRWAIEDAETTYGCLARMAKMRGLFLTSGAGRITQITKASKVVQPGALVLGKKSGNVKKARRRGRFQDRFSEYIVKSQTAGDDTYFAEAAGRGFHKVEDPQVLHYRPLIIISDGQGNAEELRTRAEWERNVRAGRSRRITYDVPGFRSLGDKGPLWDINRLIAVKDAFLDFTGNLLIISVSFTLDVDGGEMTTLELGAPEGFDILIPPKKRAKKGGGPLW